jgi:drug/metabolite transporter (DMT)-like permease
LGPSGGRIYGIVLVTAAAILWSTAGLFMRFLDLDVWTVQAWRALFGALSLFLLILGQAGSRTPAAIRAIGWRGLLAVPVSALSMVCFVAALELTTVANVLIVYATVPFVAAAVAFIWKGERMGRRALTASGIAFIGIAIMTGSATRPADLAGGALSLVMTIAFAILLVMARHYPNIAMAPINALGASLTAAVCWPLISGGGVPTPSDLAVLALFGVTTTSIAYLLFLTGARYIPASEAGLVGLLDVVLGPLWVWLAFSEDPGIPALIGGGLVLASLVWFLSDRRQATLEGNRRQAE